MDGIITGFREASCSWWVTLLHWLLLQGCKIHIKRHWH